VLISGNFHHDGLAADLDLSDLAANDYLADASDKGPGAHVHADEAGVADASPVRAWPSQRAARSAETSAAFSVSSATVTAARALRQASSASYMTLAMPHG
jgi:hypothetical protein